MVLRVVMVLSVAVAAAASAGGQGGVEEGTPGDNLHRTTRPRSRLSAAATAAPTPAPTPTPTPTHVIETLRQLGKLVNTSSTTNKLVKMELKTDLLPS